MPQWVKRVRGAIGMGLTWAVGWVLGGLLVGVMSILTPGRVWDVFFEFFDAPLPALAVPGFVGGALFSLVLGVAARHRRFDELSLSRVTAWGALGGVLLGLLPFAIGSAAQDRNVMLLGITVVTITTVLCSVSAAASLLIARRAARRDPNSVASGDGQDALLSAGRGRAEESLFDDRVNAQPIGKQTRPL